MKKSGFSLMEMMVVLLIVAIIAAASAPMINKKLLSDDTTTSDSPIMWNPAKTAAWFNSNAASDKPFVIGTAESKNAMFYVNTETNTPQIMLAYKNENPLNIFVGNQSLFLSSTDIPETIPQYATTLGYGANASENNTTALGNTAQATAEYATALGNTAQATEGNAIAIGSSAQATAKYATALGNTAQATEGNAIAIGSSAKATAGNAIAIGSSAQATAGNAIAIGNGAISNTANEVVIGDENTIVRIHGKLVVGRLAVTEKNQFYLSTNIRSNPLHQTSQSYYAYPDNTGTPLTFNRMPSAPSWVTSDRRLKDVGEAFKGGLAEIKKLDVYNYTFKKDPAKTPMVGVIAQDLQKIFPNAVIKGDDGYFRIRMEDMFYALINAVKELDNKIIAISESIKNIETDIITLKTVTEKQNTEITKLKEQNQELLKQNSEFEKRLVALEKRAKKENRE